MSNAQNDPAVLGPVERQVMPGAEAPALVERLRLMSFIVCGEAADEIERLRAEVAEWQKLHDPFVLHVSLLRGFPARLGRATFLHLAGDETPNGANNRPAAFGGSG